MAKRLKQKLTAPKKAAAKKPAESVSDFIERLSHPLKDVVIALRKVVLASDKQITEQIKWNAPSFCYQGDDRVTMNLSKANLLLIIFHRGSKVKSGKGKGRLIDGDGEILEWLADDRAVVKLNSIADLNAKKTALTKIIRQWIAAAG